MSDLRKAAEELVEAWDWDCSEPRNKALRDLIEALRQALAQPKEKMRIEGSGKLTTKPYPDGYESERDFRKALAQPEQRGHCTCGDPEALGVVHFRTRPCFHYTESLAQPEQEPVAHLWECIGRWTAMIAHDGEDANLAPPDWLVDAVKAATAPPKKEWVGLTEEERQEIVKQEVHWSGICRVIEAKLKEKNNVL